MNNRLRELREAKGWSQQELGERLGVSRQTIISIEKGKYDPSLPLAFAIARAFGSRIEDVFEPSAARSSSGPLSDVL
jgi:putative transcriptional regulator